MPNTKLLHNYSQFTIDMFMIKQSFYIDVYWSTIKSLLMLKFILLLTVLRKIKFKYKLKESEIYNAQFHQALHILWWNFWWVCDSKAYSSSLSYHIVLLALYSKTLRIGRIQISHPWKHKDVDFFKKINFQVDLFMEESHIFFQ